MQANMRVGILFFLILLIFAPISLLAGEIIFRCIVKNEYQLKDDGQLVKPDKYFYLKSSSSVERSSGKIIGGVINNEGDYQKKVTEL